MVQVLTINMIINFVKKNYKTMKSKKIDLDDNSSSDDENTDDIKPLDYQKTDQIKFLPENILEWFDLESEQYYHIGCLQNFEPKNIDYDINISLFSSILTCLLPNFLQLNRIVQSDTIQKLILKLKKEAKKRFYEFEYKNKESSFVHTDLINELDEGAFGGNIIRYIADYFHINIFILDIEEDELIFGNILNFVPYKKTIFLLKYENNIFEPLFTDKSVVNKLKTHTSNLEESTSKGSPVPKKVKYFSFNDDLIEIILDNITDIDENIKIVKKENLEKYNLKPISMSFSEKKALVNLRKKEHQEKLIKIRKDEEKELIAILHEKELSNIKNKNTEESSDSDNSSTYISDTESESESESESSSSEDD